ncbi:Hpt domain-containing protein [Aliiglaciecola lipolytica]|uniref:HPt domain-containing protein n=1 Tax=Aliiglaciecola lipolytica E3 TaxID=1127673 RepID=K6XP37_9ALTE|nr:Hpt domain-containing protein [Aliiglaciecola lipolytica]GAC13436.1 hypothetical protein GLIP_0791 [Aliiglaciecola lipolytica E3]
MDKREQIIDLDFAMSQLSGNKSLLIKLLVKFNDQYKDLAKQLTEYTENSDFKSYKEVIHTVKGVTGNLGLNALHFAAKDLETAVINQSSLSMEEDHFIAQLNATLIKINFLASEDNAQPTASNAAENESQKQLIAMLENNEFITASKLESLIHDCNITDLQKQELSVAINDLDYAEALNIINKHA